MIDPELATLDAPTRRELDDQLARWQRRRAAMAAIAIATVLLISLVYGMSSRFGSDDLSGPAPWLLLDEAVDLGLIGCCLALATFFWRVSLSPVMTVRVIGWFLMIACGGVVLGMKLLMTFESGAFEARSADGSALIAGASGIVAVLFLHLTFFAFVAMPPRAAIWPLLPVWALFALVVAGMPAAGWIRLLLAALFPLAGLPGVLWSVWRHDRFTSRFLARTWRRRYGEVHRELSEARRLLESIFPGPIDLGALRLRYAYEPMREIGGDFVFAAQIDEEAILAVLVDVTGHGVASALAVNRIHAELSRPRSGAEENEPGAVIAELNRFVGEALAGRGIYATAVAMLVDARRGVVRWASAGHPPVLLRRRGGAIEELGATAPMLGVIDAELFDAGALETPLGAGESVIAYTDGVTEAADRSRRMFGIEGIRRELSAISLRSRVPRESADASTLVLDAVRSFRHGAAADDALVVEIAHSPGHAEGESAADRGGSA
ncbi:MAG TPA: PP2C family protein-serine/threonine phosphatase [Phycisphaerales bacterium]|nr:PP2C family protein-serine/threonine phosphatase [Phycisphaerales bacterium]HMP36512.1 PP2C family protein-serine/threonine phosphatase [Phycisphaerales bacterium]